MSNSFNGVLRIVSIEWLYGLEDYGTVQLSAVQIGDRHVQRLALIRNLRFIYLQENILDYLCAVSLSFYPGCGAILFAWLRSGDVQAYFHYFVL